MPTLFQGVIPELAVPNVPAALHWYRDVLGFTIAGQTGDFFGSVVREQVNFYLRKSDAVVQTVYYWVLVEEVDQLCAAFQERGATILDALSDTPWGYRQFTLEDLNGYRFYYFRFLEHMH